MSRRHRVTFQATPVWPPGPACRDPVELSGVREGPDTPGHPTPAGSHRSAVVVAVLVSVMGAAVAQPFVDDGDRPPMPGPSTTDPAPPPGVPVDEDPPRIFIDGTDVIAAPYRGSVNRYWASDADRKFLRTHAISLVGPAGAGALLVVDATRRANVHGAAATRSPVGSSVRVLEGTGDILTLEWDQPGWGLSLTTTRLGLADALRIVDAVHPPPGPSLLSGLTPELDGAVLAGLGLGVTAHRASPTSGLGGPLVGQAGLDAVEAYVYRPEVGQPGSLQLSGTLGSSVRAAELRSALGEAVVLDPLWGDDGTVVALDLTTASPVGYRVTGERRVVFDHPSGVTFWLVSDQLPLEELLAAGRSIDFDRIALRMTRT